VFESDAVAFDGRKERIRRGLILMKTKAAYMKAPWQFELRDVEIPDRPPSGWIMVRVEACGVCGTDLAAAALKAGQWGPFGHEIAGVVEALGDGVDNLKTGQAIVLESGSYCGKCDLCHDGRVDLCTGRAPHFWGQPAMGFSRHMMAPACSAVPYEGLSPDVACLTECSGVAYDMVRTAGISMGDRVAVIGPGPIGLVAVALARHQAPGRLLTIGKTSGRRRLEMAAELGSETLAFDGNLAELRDFHRQFDHVLMTAPVEFIEPALSLLAYGGEMTYIGIGTGPGRIGFDANDFHFRKLQLRASFASPAIYFPAVLRLLNAGIIPGKKLVSHVFRLEQIADAMITCRDRKSEVLKVVVKP